jgi:D-lactate dehydrogenase (cytochrome)
MDLIDLFIGAEGTLGVVTEVELRLSAPRPAWFAGFTPVAGDRAAIDLVAELRAESKRTWSGAQSAETGADVAAVEYIDGRCLELLREDGAFAQVGIPCPDDAGAAVIFQAELPAGTTRDAAFEQLGRLDSAGVETPLLRLCRILVDHGVFDRTLPVLPGETGRRDALLRLREAVPAGVNRRIRERQRTIDATISKAACDVIVPFERFAESLARYRDILGRYELDHAIWGHISDGNVHPNILPADGEQMARAGRALIELGDAAIALGGCPMSEHGVGRSPLKQELLRRLYGDDGVAAMRAVKQALDPEWLLAPGVLFAQPASE